MPEPPITHTLETSHDLDQEWPETRDDGPRYVWMSPRGRPGVWAYVVHAYKSFGNSRKHRGLFYDGEANRVRYYAGNYTKYVTFPDWSTDAQTATRLV